MPQTTSGPPHDIDITFVVVNFNMAGLVYQLVENIRQQSRDKLCHRILIGDNSTDPNFAVDERYSAEPDIEVHRIPPNRGFVAALNHILDHANSRYVALLHPDVEFKGSCLEDLLRFMDAHPRVGIVSPNLLYPSNEPCKIRLRFATAATEGKRLVNLVARSFVKHNIVADEELWDRCADAEAEMTMSVCMVIRGQVLESVGRLNENLWTYFLNDWLCHRARSLGYSCYYLRDAIAIHHERFSDPKLFSQKPDLDYKTTPLPVEARMQRDRFTFLRSRHTHGEVLTFKLLAASEYLYLVATNLPRWRSRRSAIRGYWLALRALPKC